jgi:hypothetical protein
MTVDERIRQAKWRLLDELYEASTHIGWAEAWIAKRAELQAQAPKKALSREQRRGRRR